MVCFPLTRSYHTAGVTRSKLGGQLILDLYKEYFAEKEYDLVPKYLIAKRVWGEDIFRLPVT